MLHPFNPANEAAYHAWREHKLAAYPAASEQLIVDIKNPAALTAAELEALRSRCRKTNMVIYRTACGADPDKEISRAMARQLARQLGLSRMDRNLLADEDGVTPLAVAQAGERQNYIPYTNRALKWHTDGYYNTDERRIWAFQLHCVQAAAEGGENALLDHEIAYLLMRDENPDFIVAMMQADAMTIPARTDDEGVARPAQTGPVFYVDPVSGALHMRYTARKRSIEWKQSAATLAAVAFLEKLLDPFSPSPSPYIFHARLAPGMGLFCNNVLHDRTAFRDDDRQQRLIYRARFYDRVAIAGEGACATTAAR